jgi:hypothetical protein
MYVEIGRTRELYRKLELWSLAGLSVSRHSRVETRKEDKTKRVC